MSVHCLDPQAAKVDTFARIIGLRRTGSLLSCNDVRAELSAASIEGNAIGHVFRWAEQSGRLVNTGRSVPSTERAARGRRVALWRVTAAARKAA